MHNVNLSIGSHGGLTGSGIGFGQTDGGLSRLFFLICYHDDAQHLRVLARLMRLLDHETIQDLLTANSVEEARQVMLVREEQVVEGDG